MAFDVIYAIFNNTLFFIFFIVFLFALIGWLTGSFSVGVFAGFLMFVNITVQQDNTLLTNLLYISMVAILFFTAFKVYGFAMGGNGGIEG